MHKMKQAALPLHHEDNSGQGMFIQPTCLLCLLNKLLNKIAYSYERFLPSVEAFAVVLNKNNNYVHLKFYNHSEPCGLNPNLLLHKQKAILLAKRKGGIVFPPAVLQLTLHHIPHRSGKSSNSQPQLFGEPGWLQ